MVKAVLNPIAEVMPDLLKRIGVTPEKFALAFLVEQKLSDMCNSAQIVGMSKNVIYVEVESSTELQELSLRRREIFKMIRSVCPENSLSTAPEIKFFLKGMAKQPASDRCQK